MNNKLTKEELSYLLTLVKADEDCVRDILLDQKRQGNFWKSVNINLTNKDLDEVLTVKRKLKEMAKLK